MFTCEIVAKSVLNSETEIDVLSLLVQAYEFQLDLAFSDGLVSFLTMNLPVARTIL